jgi:hypothetical protein
VQGIWLSVSFSLISAISMAGETQTQISFHQDGEQIYIQPDQSGGATITSNSGQILKFTKEHIQYLSEIYKSSKPEFEKSNPCLATTTEK